MPREGFGYISRQGAVLEPPSYRTCVFYSGDEKDDFFSGDGMWRAGKAMSLLACGVGGIVMCIVMCTCCVAYQLPTFDALFWTLMFCFVAQSLTFLSWGSDLCDEMECTWSSGTGMNITAAMLWVWAANMVKSFPEALPPRGRGRRKPIYEDEDGDDPYLYSNRGFDDDDYYEEDQWQGDEEYDENGGYHDEDGNYIEGSAYDDGTGYYDDDTGYGEQSYDDGSYPSEYDSQDPNAGYVEDGYVDPYAPDPAYAQDPYATDYVEPEPEPEHRQGKDDEFEPDPAFQETWKDNAIDNESMYDSSRDSNAFQEDADSLRNSQAGLSQEEMQFLGQGDDADPKQESFRDIDQLVGRILYSVCVRRLSPYIIKIHSE